MIHHWGPRFLRLMVVRFTILELKDCGEIIIRKSVVEPVRITLTALEEEGILDPDNEMDIYCLHQALSGRINRKLSGFTHSWNNHPLRSEHNFTPLQLFHSCDQSGLSDDDSEADDNPLQLPSIRDHVVVPSNRFSPCVFLIPQVQTILATQDHLDDRGLYRSIAESVGSHIGNMSGNCCTLN